MSILRAWFGGLWTVARAPHLVLFTYLLLAAVTVPAGVAVHFSLPAPTSQAPNPSERGAPDPDWLDEVSLLPSTLLQAFGPSLVGVAAPLSQLSAIVEGTMPPWPGVAVTAVFFACWTAIVGGLITRWRRDSRIGAKAFTQAASRSAPPLFILGGVGVLALVLILMAGSAAVGSLHGWLTADMLERSAAIWRFALALPVALALLVVGQIVDYARIEAVVSGVDSKESLIRATGLVRRRPMAVCGVVALHGLVFAALVASYGAIEFVPGGSVPTFTRLLVAGQALIIGRLTLRLILLAAQVRLHQSSELTH